MKLKLLFVLPCMYIMLTSATFIRTGSAVAGYANNPSLTAHAKSAVIKAAKLNFFQRLVVKLIMKKNRLMETLHADKLAHTSLALGIAACGTLFLGLFVPFIILLSLPLGIAAMITGGTAERKGTSYMSKAATGKGLGLGALIAFAVLLIVVAVILSSLNY